MNLLAINSTKNCCEISNNRFSKLKVKKQLLLILTFLFLGTFNLFSQTTGSCTPAANPAFSTECDMCVIVVLDESGSTSNISTQIKNAMISFAGALNDPCLDVNMAIVEYGSRARIANIGGTAGFRYVNTDFVNDLTPYFDGGGTSASTYNSSGGTNWDHGLQVAKTLADSPSAPCDNPYIVMFSDGNPTYAGSLNQIGNGFSTSTAVLEAACNSANALKNNGSRIFTVALPNPNLVTSNVQAIENGSSSLEYVSSNPGVGQTTNIRLADYLSTNSSNVGTAFTALAAGIAQPTISTTSVSGPIDGFCPEIIAPTFTVNHDCQGDPTPTVNTSGPTNNGCEFSQTWEASYAHTGVCPAVAENVSITYTWFQDTTAPTINCPTEVIDLGEDPNSQTLPTEASVEAYIETLSNDNCEILSTVATAGAISNSDCVNTQEFTVVVTDKCGLIDECTLTYTWKTDCCVPAAICNNLIDVPLESCVATIPSNYDAGNTDAEIADVFSGVVTCGIAGIRHEDSNAGDICNGTTITRTYYLTDDGVDVPGVICTRDFVFTVPSLTINCPTNVALPSCSTEQVIIDAYNLWVSEITVSGGCNTISNIADIPALPSYDCDAGVLLNFTLETSDDCGTVSCETRFLVDVPETLIVSCPQDVVLPACSTEQEILVAYNNWVGEFLAEGDCNLTSNIADIPALPTYDCEALVYIDFTFEASNDCDTASCNSRFIVDNEETLQVVCPQDVNLPACSTEQEILTAYNNWVGDFLAEGDCNMTSNIADIPALPIYDCDAGVNLQFTLTAVNSCGTASCSSSFVVQDELDLEVNCPTGVSLDSSSTEQEIQDAYDAWKLGFTMNGGCNASDNLDTFPSLPDFNCGTAVDLNFTYTATDRCHPNGVSCSSTFFVPGVIGLTVDCPTDVSLASCASEADILSAYNTWISGFGVNDGDDPLSNIGDIPALPAYECGVAVDLSFTLRATDACHPNGVSCMSTFNVEAAAPLELSSKPDDVTTSACVNPADEFASWISALESMSALGGCNALVEYSLDLNTLSVDGYCNTSAQVISVDINAKDDCGETTPVTATFTVPAYSNDLSLLGSCPTDNEVEGCSTNAEISSAFDLWKSAVLSNFSATGGCNAEVEYSTDVSALQAPIQCGSVDQVISVDVKAIDDCGETSVTTCSFTVKAFESTLEVTDVEDEIYDSCDYASQGELDLVFQAFLDKFGFTTGGCDASGQLASAYSAPDLCVGGTVNVTYNVTDLCENGSDTASFTITSSSALEVSCPTGVSLDSSSTEQEIQDAYDTWKLGFTMNGGCNASDNLDTFPSLPDYICDTNINLLFEYTATDRCHPNGVSCSSTFSIEGREPVDAGVNGMLTICENGTITAEELFEALEGNPNEGGTWSPELEGVGIYTYTVQGTEPCPDATATVTVEELLLEISASEPVCDENYGTYSVNVQVSEGAVSSSLGTPVDNGGGSWSIIDVPIDNDIVVTTTTTVSNDVNCTNSVNVISPNCICIELDLEYSDVSCFGLDDGAITVNFVTEGATVTVNGAPYDVNMLYVPGTYTVVAYFEGNDNEDCIISEDITIVEPALVDVQVSSTDATCYGADDGTITIESLSEGAYYTIKRNGVGSDLSGQEFFAPGTYVVEARLTSNLLSRNASDVKISERSQNPCIDARLVVIGQPDMFMCRVGKLYEGNEIRCNDRINNTLTVNHVGGTGPYTYSWSMDKLGYYGMWEIQSGGDQETMTFIPGLGSATFIVEVTDANGCITVCDFKLKSTCTKQDYYNNVFRNSEFDFEMYPNPTKGSLTITLNKLTDKGVVVELFDLVGTRMINQTFSKIRDNKIDINLTGLASQVYYLKVTTKDGTKIKKVVLDK